MSTYPNAGSSSRIAPAWTQSDYQEDMDGTEEEDNVFKDMSFEDVLEELIARFMVNLPRMETTPVRLYWQAEEAHWYYDDFIRPLNPSLPPLSQKHFTKILIASSPLYANVVDEAGKPINYDSTWEEYTRYKRMVPTCGVALINAKESKTLLVRHYGAKAWSWPRGKINENETEDDCAVRELEEETGYDCSRSIDPNAKCEAFINGQSSTMFFVTGVDESFPFAARTRNEIEETRWVNLQDLPTWSRKRPKTAEKSLVFFKVAPFVHALKHFLHNPNRGDRSRPKNLQSAVRNDASVPAAIAVNSVPAVSSHPITQPATALDKLFANFVHSQEADLKRGGPGGDEDNRNGIERLFGNVSVSANEQARKEENEDDALARLLGAIGTSATPAPTQQHQQLEPGKSNLLSLLNQKTPAAPQMQPPPQQASPQQHDLQTPKPHTANLLAMLASPAQVAAKSSQAAPMPQVQHDSLPTTPRPPSPPADDRISKQRALLEMTLAGLSLDNTNSAHQTHHVQPSYHGADYGNANQTSAYHEPLRISPPQPPMHQQYRPPVQPAAFPPSSGAYYTNNPAQPPQSHHSGPSYPNGHGPSPPRIRGAPPPPYESHYGGPGPVRPMPPVVPAQPVHDYIPHGQGYYARPQPPIPTQGQSYRPHLPPQPQQQPFSSRFQQPYVPTQNAYQPSYGGPTGYQAPSHRPPPHQGPSQLQPQHPPLQQQQQQPYIPSVQGHVPNNGGGGNVHHTGPMHQPIPKTGSGGVLLAMLNHR